MRGIGGQPNLFAEVQEIESDFAAALKHKIFVLMQNNFRLSLLHDSPHSLAEGATHKGQPSFAGYQFGEVDLTLLAEGERFGGILNFGLVDLQGQSLFCFFVAQ
jgi:hypothetical protein